MAGHVDHGKTTLAEALTGATLDRRPEEREREMTIGLAVVRLALGDGTVADLIDVPGHEALVHTMVRGAASIDCGLLVVAADDGPMPQTREHLTVLELLEVPHVVVALTKLDVAEGDIADLAHEETQALLAATPWPEAPIIRVGARDSKAETAPASPCGHAEDLGELRDALTRAASLPGRDAQGGPLRVPIDRVFSVTGHGTIVTGRITSGALALPAGAGRVPLALEPGGRPVRLRGLQRHGSTIGGAAAGDRVALNLSGVSVDEVAAGDLVAEPQTLRATHRFDARLTLSDDAPKPLDTGERVRLHVLASNLVARVRLLDTEVLHPGDRAFAQLTVQRPICVLPRDRFVIRTLSPAWTVGGGVVLDAAARRARARDKNRVPRLVLLEDATPSHTVLAALATCVDGATASELVARVAMDETDIATALANASSKGSVVALDVPDGTPPGEETRYVSRERFRSARETLLAEVESLHAQQPAAAAHPRATVISRSGLPLALAEAVIERLLGEERIFAPAPDELALSGWRPHLDAKTAEAVGEVQDYVRAAGSKPIRPSELADRFVRVPPARLRTACDHLVATGRLARLRGSGEGRGALVDPASLASAQRVISDLLRTRPGGYGLTELRDALGVGRHPAQWLAEHFDAEGLTERAGETRLPAQHRDPPAQL